MTDKLRRNNHYLSQMYLDAWSDDNKVEVYDLLVPNENVPKWKTKSIKSVGSYDSMFVRLKEGIETDDIEKWFGEEYESPARIALDHAIKGEDISKEEWYLLIRFISCHIVRSPIFIMKTLKTAQELGPKVLKELKEELEKTTKETIEKYTKKEETEEEDLFPLQLNIRKEGEEVGAIEVETILGKQLYLWFMMRCLKNTSQILHQYRWGIMDIDKKVTIPTSDNPVVFLNYRSQKDYHLNGDWTTKNGNILFPISPHKIIYCQIGTEPTARWEVDYDTSKFLKKVIVENAYKKVISSKREEDISKIAPREVSEEAFLEEEKMWKDFQKNYLEEEAPYIK